MRRVILIAAIVLAGTLLALGYNAVRGERIDQPLAFNHSLHIEQAGTACLHCHSDARDSVHAGLPGKDVCLDCHDPDDLEDQAESGELDVELAKLVDYAESDQEIRWQRVAITKPDVFFSHRMHVGVAALDCERCHPRQSKLTAPPSHAREVMTMDDCLQCHEQQKVSTDCLVCHR